MANPAVNYEMRAPARQRRFRKIILIAAFCVAAVVLCAVLMGRYWPFSKNSVLQCLREATDSQVSVRSFRETYFPSPGCVLEGIVFQHGSPSARPLLTIEKLTVKGSYTGLLVHRIPKIIAEAAHISIPPFGTGTAFNTQRSKITIGELIANGAVIEFESRVLNKKPVLFDVHQATLRHIRWARATAYDLKVHNPEPPGDVSVTGSFGPWSESDSGETPISGHYLFNHADLSIYRGIAGILSSTGNFSGKLSHIDISGTTDTPDFEVKSGGHPVRLTTQFSAYVDATRGNTFLKQVDADFWKTHITAKGSIAKPEPGKAQTALLDLSSNSARIQDLLGLFVKDNLAPMSGWTTFQAQAEIPPGPEEFLKKVKFRAEFGIGGGTFTNSSTQHQVDKLSAGAQGEKNTSDAGLVLTNLKGREDLVNGVATFSDLSFHIPGAASRMHGTYNVISERIDLRGQLRVDTQISNTQTGVKSLLLKVIQPFFKRKKKGQIVPVRLAGTYDHPTFGLDLRDKRAQLRPLHPEQSNQ
ncbi:MAG: AsmA-like C-terminal region-containing protein [Candidatus Sulfotelmatobacter sp.]